MSGVPSNLDFNPEAFVRRGIYRNFHFYTHKWHWTTIMAGPRSIVIPPQMFPGQKSPIPAPLGQLREAVDRWYALEEEERNTASHFSDYCFFYITEADHRELESFYAQVAEESPPEWNI